MYLRLSRLIPAVAFVAALSAAASTSFPASAQSGGAPAPSAALDQATTKALQEALVKQGIPVKTDGVMNDETRAAIKQYQSQHHLPVTGEADKATLDKLGVAAPKGAGIPGGAGMPQGGMGGQGMMGGGMMKGQGGMGGGMMGGGMMKGQGGMGSGQSTPPGQGMGQGQGGMPKQ